jgi:hypothetical protein
VGDHGASEFGDRHHAAFDMHVRVAKPWYQIAASCLDHPRSRANCRAGIWPDIGDALAGDCDIDFRYDLAAVHVDPAPTSNHKIGVGAAHGDIDEMPSIEPSLASSDHESVSGGLRTGRRTEADYEGAGSDTAIQGVEWLDSADRSSRSKARLRQRTPRLC